MSILTDHRISDGIETHIFQSDDFHVENSLMKMLRSKPLHLQVFQSFALHRILINCGKIKKIKIKRMFSILCHQFVATNLLAYAAFRDLIYPESLRYASSTHLLYIFPSTLLVSQATPLNRKQSRVWCSLVQLDSENPFATLCCH